MSEVAIFGTVAGAMWGVLLALLGVVWTMHRERIAMNEVQIAALVKQNTEQETMLGRLTERMVARENAHSEHREHMTGQFERLDASIRELSLKLDRVLGSRTPYPSTHRGPPGGE